MKRKGRGGGSLDICMPHRTINENFRICQSIITSSDSTDPGMGSTGLRFCCVVNYVACCGCFFISRHRGALVQALQAAAQVDAEIKSRQDEASRVELS